MTTPTLRLYIVVRQALRPGLKMAQACHALRAFVEAFPEQDQAWFEHSNNIVVLEETDLETEAERLERLGYPLAFFHEPDLDDQLTAFATLGVAEDFSELRLAG